MSHFGILFRKKGWRVGNPFVNVSDEKLMILYQQGEKQAFEVLYRRYDRKVFSYLSRRIGNSGHVDDQFQMVFLKFHRSRMLYKPEHLLAKWLFVICKSVLTDYYRKQGRESKLLHDLELDELSGEDRESSPKDIEDYINDSSLKPHEKKALQLRYQQDHEFHAIAKTLGIEEASSRKVISRALKKLKAIYGGKHD